MKRRKKVWVVLERRGGVFEVFFKKKMAITVADIGRRNEYQRRVVPAVLEYDVPEKKEAR